MDYTLNLIIDTESLRVIKAAQLMLTLAKPVGAEQPNVTWMVFDPFEGNTIKWTEEYGIYSSPSQLNVAGTIVSRISEKFPAEDAMAYPFAGNTFNTPQSGSLAPLPGSFKIQNQNTGYPMLTFGLEQKASINTRDIDASPINASIVPFNYDAIFTPTTTVYVWLQSVYTSGCVLTSINGRSTAITFGDGVTTKTVKYDSQSGLFKSSSSGGVFQDDHSVVPIGRPGVY